MPVILSETRGANYTAVYEGGLVWANVLFEGETHFGDKIRIVATPPMAAGGRGMGVSWNRKKEVATAGEFTERVASIFTLMAALRDRFPEEEASEILTIFHELWGPWYTRFVQSWSVSPMEVVEEEYVEDGEE